MNHSEFSDLLERYRNGLATPEEAKLIEEWYEAIEGDPAPLSQAEKDKRKKRTLNTILHPQKTAAPRSITLRKLFLTSASVAASLVLFFFISYYTTRKTEISQPKETTGLILQKKEDQLFTNNGKTNRLIILDEGSSVLLTPGSSFSCKAGFGTEHRKTRLSGNAFFEIARNPELPFFVLCEEILTEVVGTSFWIKSSAKAESVEVSVHTGKVSVFKKTSPSNKKAQSDAPKPVTLLPNQKALFSVKSLTGKVKIQPSVPDEKVDQPKKYNYVFEKKSLREVFEVISEDYNLDIQLNLLDAANCTFTGDLSDLTVVEKLDIIRFSTGISYDIRETSLVISSNGCN